MLGRQQRPHRRLERRNIFGTIRQRWLGLLRSWSRVGGMRRVLGICRQR